MGGGIHQFKQHWPRVAFGWTGRVPRWVFSVPGYGLAAELFRITLPRKHMGVAPRRANVAAEASVVFSLDFAVVAVRNGVEIALALVRATAVREGGPELRKPRVSWSHAVSTQVYALFPGPSLGLPSQGPPPDSDVLSCQ